ncbi:MAG: hypothetical protein V2A65_07885 [Candidatus Omnitrophota bacterium]
MVLNRRIESIGEHCSLYSFIKQHCLGESSGLSHNSAFHRLCSLARKMRVETAVIEEIAPEYAEISDECIALIKYFGQPIKFQPYRITFLTERVSSFNDILSLSSEHFLASAVVMNFQDPKKDNNWKSYLFNALFTIPKIRNYKGAGTSIPLQNNYLHIHKKFKREISISKDETFQFDITGTFFCQQNSLTSVCAHASLCMVLNNTREEADLITPENINKIVGVDHEQVKLKGGGGDFIFSNEQIKKVLNQYGLTYRLIDFFENPNIEYNEYIYRYIESKCPVLLIFTTHDILSDLHVVPIFGHTLNSDKWQPEAQSAYSNPPAVRTDYFMSTSAWVDHFIIHDDNLGMYFCLPVDSLKRITLPKYDPAFRANYAVIILPAKVTTLHEEAEWAATIVTLELLESRKGTPQPLDDWTNRIIDRIGKVKPIVMRTFLTTKEDYAESLEKSDFEENVFTSIDKEELLKILPSRFWLSEITIPDLFTANKTKIIDFFYGCEYPESRNPKIICTRWLQIRFPYVLIRNDGGTPQPAVSMSVKSHYPLLKFEHEQDTLDW